LICFYDNANSQACMPSALLMSFISIITDPDTSFPVKASFI